MSHTDVKLGPVEYLVVAFPAGQANFSGEMTSELRALMDSNTLRVLDLVVRARLSGASGRRPGPVRAGRRMQQHRCG